ncbi:MAG: DUF3667 domain-containing protein [Deltaproteobacteria bacterium]|nr:DUF3667 domain-containing protein [Deltaproteobacteria bacterium]
MPCINCGTEVSLQFCPQCGERRGDYRRSLMGFLRELLSETFEIDGRVGRTFRLLLLSPGALTREYQRGRRQRYVSPLRLYLFVSLLLFGAIAIAAKVQAARQSPPTVGAAPPVVIAGGDPHGAWWQQILHARSAELEGMSANAAGAELIGGMLDVLPIAMALLLPVFAGLLMLTSLRQRRYYVEHLVFAVHVHSFWFLLTFVVIPLTFITDWLFSLMLLIPAYTVVALKNAYQASWRATALRSLLLWLPYNLLLVIAIPILFVLGLLFGG